MTMEKRQVSIAQWHALAQRGTVLLMRIPLEGDSMRPLIRRSRDLLFFVPLTRPLRRSDVQTLGDHCWNPDPWIPSAAVLGMATVERGSRRIPLDSPLARALGRAWMAGLPLRRGWWRCRALAGRCLRRMGWRR